MSDPVANVDIEDVLSSIRRLVSNGPEKDGDASGPSVRGDRLVLTPSQRVDETGEAEDADMPAPAGGAEETEGPVPEADPPHAIARDTETTAPDADEELRDALSQITTGAEAEAARGPLSPDLSDAADEGETRDWRDADDETAVEFEDEDGGEDGREGEDGGAGHHDPALEGIAAMFARHETTGPSTWEPDGDDEDAFAEGAAAPSLEWRDVDDSAEAHKPEAASADQPGGDWPQADSHDFVGDGDVGMDGDGDNNAFASDDEAVLDEEALRDLVAEIVREELMGTLGERITRNVRKLVRREIHRALNSQDFD